MTHRTQHAEDRFAGCLLGLALGDALGAPFEGGPVVTAVYLGLRHLREPFLELQAFVAHCGGDVDTIGALSGALWGAANGMSRLPEPSLNRLEDRDRIHDLALALHRVSVRVHA
jgi:ADP-ribosylglycohydrolase